MTFLLTILLCGVPTVATVTTTSPQDTSWAVNPSGPVQTSATKISSTTAATQSEERPLTAIPAWLRPFVIYGGAGGVALWFVGSIIWMARQRLKQAKTPEQQTAAKQWLRRMLVSISLAVALLGAGVALSIMKRELIYIWVAAPVALLLPPLLLAWWGKK
jgi:hypothetical protein